MRNRTIFLMSCLCLFATTRADALLDIFTVYGKRNNQIEKIIISSLSSPKNKWERTHPPIPEQYESWSGYASQNDPRIKFNFYEFNYSKHPSIRTIDDVFNDTKKRLSGDFDTSTSHEKGATIKERNFHTLKEYSRTDQILCYEKIIHHASQKVKKEFKNNILGEQHEETIPLGPEVVDDIPVGYTFNMLIDLGRGKFRRYTYWIDKKQPLPSEAEITFLLQLFQYMESQIRNVDA